MIDDIISLHVEKSTLVITQFVHSEDIFNVRIILVETNYDVCSQLIEMNITHRVKLSYIHGKKFTTQKAS